jgi:integrase
MSNRITLQSVKAAKPSSKRYVLWDATVKGFGLRVSPDGRKTYIVKTRVASRQVFISLGEHGSPLTPDMARKEALQALSMARAGVNPAAAKRAERHARLTVEELCREYLVSVEAGRVLTKSSVCKAASTLLNDRGRIARHIIPLIGHRKVRETTRQDVEKLRDDVKAGRTAIDEKTSKRGRAIVTGGPGAATRALGLLGGIFSYALSQGYCDHNPVKGVQRFRDGKQERFLSPAELERLGRALTEAEAEGTNNFATAAIRLLVLSGCRKSEVLTLKWSYVDYAHSCLRLPTSKTGAKVVPLGAPALALLATLPRLAENPYVFPGAKVGGHLVGLPRFFYGIRKRANLTDVRLHDLRHSFASAGAAGGLSLPLIGALLGHKDAKTTLRYAHLADDPVKVAADRISATIEAAMAGAPSSGIAALPMRRNST